MKPTRRNLFQMFAAALAAAKVPIVVKADAPPPAPTLRVAAKVQDEWVEIPKVTSIEAPRRDYELIDITNHGSGAFREYLAGPGYDLIIIRRELGPPDMRAALCSLEPKKFMVRFPFSGQVKFKGYLKRQDVEVPRFGIPEERLEFHVLEAMLEDFS